MPGTISYFSSDEHLSTLSSRQRYNFGTSTLNAALGVMSRLYDVVSWMDVRVRSSGSRGARPRLPPGHIWVLAWAEGAHWTRDASMSPPCIACIGWHKNYHANEPQWVRKLSYVVPGGSDVMKVWWDFWHWLSEMYCWIWGWMNFENRLPFGEVTGKTI